MHGPLHSLRKLVNQSQIDSPIDYSAILKFPDEVGLCTSSIPGIEYGVCAKAAIPSGTWIGPYEGRLVRPEQIKKETETEYMWEVGKNNPEKPTFFMKFYEISFYQIFYSKNRYS